jgi:glycosyltransferase involved in cell wall biosynthesis
MKAIFKRGGGPVYIPAVVGPKPTLSICMTVLEDREETNHTIESIRATAGDIEIVVVDDFSSDPVEVKYPGVKYHRNSERLGVARSRDIAVAKATGSYILITDSHMRFRPDWYPKIMSRLGDPMQAWNGCCLGLDSDHMDIFKPKGEYCGANLVIWKESDKTIFEGKWMPSKPGDNYEVPCFMGASYFISKELYGKVLGLGALRQWGSDEPYLSSKIWLAGGSIRMAKDVKIGHKFRKAAPYKSKTWCLHYNKLRAVKEVFGDPLYRLILSKMERSNTNVRTANIQLIKDAADVERHRAHYSTVFKHDYHWLCDKFGMQKLI